MVYFSSQKMIVLVVTIILQIFLIEDVVLTEVIPLRQLENSLTRVNKLLADIDIKISSERDLLHKLDKENDNVNDLNEALRRLPALRSSDRDERRHYSFKNSNKKKPTIGNQNTEDGIKMKTREINRNETITKLLRDTQANETPAVALSNYLTQILETVFPDNTSLPLNDEFTRLQRRMSINTKHVIKYNKLIRHFILKHTTLFHTFAKHYKHKHHHSRHHKKYHKHRHGSKNRNKYETVDMKNKQEQMEEEIKGERPDEDVEKHEELPQLREGAFEQDPVANENTELNVNRAIYLDQDVHGASTIKPKAITTIKRNRLKNANLETVLQDASYSYEEIYLKTMLLDALFHGNDTVDIKPQKV